MLGAEESAPFSNTKQMEFIIIECKELQAIADELNTLKGPPPIVYGNIQQDSTGMYHLLVSVTTFEIEDND